MKSALEQAKLLPGYTELLAKLKSSANYYVACNGDMKDRLHAIDLCLAHVFLETFNSIEVMTPHRMKEIDTELPFNNGVARGWNGAIVRIMSENLDLKFKEIIK